MTSDALSCIATVFDEDEDELLIEYAWTDEQGNVLGEADTLQLTPAIIQPEQNITSWSWFLIWKTLSKVVLLCNHNKYTTNH